MYHVAFIQNRGTMATNIPWSGTSWRCYERTGNTLPAAWKKHLDAIVCHTAFPGRVCLFPPLRVSALLCTAGKLQSESLAGDKEKSTVSNAKMTLQVLFRPSKELSWDIWCRSSVGLIVPLRIKSISTSGVFYAHLRHQGRNFWTVFSMDLGRCLPKTLHVHLNCFPFEEVVFFCF